MKKYLPFLLLLGLLAGCQAPPEEGPAPTPTPAPTASPAPTPTPALSEAPAPKWDALEELIAGVTAEDIGNVSWGGPNEPPAAEDLIPLLHRAAEHIVDRADGGAWTDTIWDLDLYIAPKDAPVYSGDDALHLYAGLEEDVVEISGGINLPEGTVHVKDHDLYQLLRTKNDTEGYINTTYYERCKDIVDPYFDQLAEEQHFQSWELNEFLGVIGTSKIDGLGFVLFRMEATYRGADDEDTLLHLAGGTYVDSGLRAHADAEPVYLITSDGKPVGFAFGDRLAEALQTIQSLEQVRQGLEP